MIQQKRIAIFGSTGSIGTQTLQVIEEHPDLFRASILTAQTNDDLLIRQALKFNPECVVIGSEQKYKAVSSTLQAKGIKVLAGEHGLEEAASMDYDMMLAAIVGYAGLKPTLIALEHKKPIALANKETLVVAGDIVMRKAMEGRIPIIPVDSEHSAIFQCLVGEGRNRIEKIILTASGGPFRGKKTNFLSNVRPDHALQHPNWNMGAKVTIDSATLMNKGLEMIEAKWLFNLDTDQIKVVVHPQSIIHSMVMFEDGSIKAQMGLPDMRLPIQYAISFPERIQSKFPRYQFQDPSSLEFEQPDMKTFQCLPLAIKVMERGGNFPCVMNAANEIAVYAFLRQKIGFLDIPELIAHALTKVPYIEHPGLDDLFESDGDARNFVASKVKL